MRKLIHWLQAGCKPVSPLSLKIPSVAISLGLSLAVPLYFGLLTLLHARTSGPIIQDDARLHIVWLQQLIDPALFPQDAIADYYTAIQPLGFQALYGLAAALSIAPLLFAKVVPTALALIATVYLFRVALLIFPVPLSGLLVTLVFNQNIWLKDDLVSATPRAFVYPLFAAFLYYLLRNMRWLSLLTLGLQGLFYPQMMLVSLGLLTLRLLKVRAAKQLQRDIAFWGAALVITAGLLVLFSHRTAAQVGPLVSLGDMTTMPEFQADGRREYFGVSPLHFAFAGASGLRFPLFPPIICTGALLPLMLRKRWTVPITREVVVLPQLFFSAVALFLLAHGLFPRLYLPSRYTFYSLRCLMAIATGLVLTLLLYWFCWNWRPQERHWKWREGIQVGLSAALAIAVIVVPAVPAIFLPCHGWVEGEFPGLYGAIAQTPKETLVASISPEADNVPAFAQRSVLVGREFALPYHSAFYDIMLQRMADLVAAQYSAEVGPLVAFIQTYGVDLWLVDRQFTEPEYLTQQDWLMRSSIGDQITPLALQLAQGRQPALRQFLPTCDVFVDDEHILLDTACIVRRAKLGEFAEI
ncbi:MAG: hypothetical protein ACFB4J_17360 [Elainellaceae cyanobacterium]